METKCEAAGLEKSELEKKSMKKDQIIEEHLRGNADRYF